MRQPEISFILKLIRIRRVAERIHANRKPNVMATVDWLERHIQANGYHKPNESRWFFINHFDKVEFIIPGGKPKLLEELNKLRKEVNYETVK